MKTLVKIIICIIAFAFMSQKCSAWEFEKNIESNTRNVGSVKSIGGKTYIIVIYASYEGEANVSDLEKQCFKESLNRAIIWLEWNVEYGKKNTTEKYIVDYNHNEVKVSKNINLSRVKPRIVSEKAYGKSYENIIKNKARENDCEDYMVIVCTNSTSSICVSYVAGGLLGKEEPSYLEGCVINAGYSKCLDTRIAHEILHTYGAWDLYNYREKDGSRVMIYTGELTGKEPTWSIMYDVWKDITDFSIDSYTAYLIGLSTYRPKLIDSLSEHGAR